MANVEQTIRKAIQVVSPEVLKHTEKLISVIEDLSPELVEEKNILRRTYSDELGKLLYEAYCSRESGRSTTWREIKSYLDETIGMKESKQVLFIQWFKGAFVNNKRPQTSGANSAIMFQNHTLNGQRQSLVRLLYKMSILKTGIENAKKAEQSGKVMNAIRIYQRYNDGSCYEIEAQLRLGQLYESFPEESYKHYLRAAQLGNAEAAFCVGYMNENGEGVTESITQAIIYYNQAVQAGHRDAAHNLGFIYYSGNIVNKDLKHAFDLFYMAAMRGKAESMRALGVMYENGDFVKRDYAKALFWYIKAFENGYSDAEKDRQRVQRQIKYSRRR